MFPKRFDYQEAEPRIYRRWKDENAFRTAYDSQGNLQDPSRKDARPFVIVIPPPNITGRLHMGHALNNTVQDLLTRAKRMDGYDALWVPGTDHAGIATQTVVKKQLDAEGIDMRALGREETVRRIWEWRNKYGSAILNQLERMGCSCDWSRTRFTMDEGLNRAVRESFVRLYQDGLIYRGKRIVNWCPVDRTALSDDEVEKEDEKGKMFHIRYPLQDDSTQYMVVATTRPETLFGDVAVAVNPKDPRYTAMVGKNVVLPLQGRIIPVIADEWADPEKGTGVVKITPAHDPNDFEVGQRHELTPINVMNEDATMNEVVPERYRGLDRYACRRKALEELEELGLLEETKDHILAIGRSYRSKQPIEFRLSDQWFVKMGPLAEQALAASGFTKGSDGWQKTEPGDLSLHPSRFDKVYLHWLSNIRDWCISRQIWWGHRIPAWFHKETGEILVDLEEPARVKAEPEKWRQEEDVLDTWFSSWLWPLSVFGWPEKTPDFERYYPTTVLSTAKDILFFWVARMNFAGLRFDGRLPYRHVYLHSTIADETGTTMSKSKGNGIDPLTLIDGATLEELKQPVMDARPSNMKELLKRVEKNFPNGFEAVGADAMRWTLIYSITEGENVRLSLPRFTEGRNFVTKLWNGAGRILSSLEAETVLDGPIAPMTEEDQWLLARLDSTTRVCRACLEDFDFGKMAQELYHFVWDDYCSWGLEWSKTRLTSQDPAERRAALKVMGSVLADLLRLLHPVVPFVTEELWSLLVPQMNRLGLWLDDQPTSALLIRDHYPKPRKEPQVELERRIGIKQDAISLVRSVEASGSVDSGDFTLVATPEVRSLLEGAIREINQLSPRKVVLADRAPAGTVAYPSAFAAALHFVPAPAYVERLKKDLEKGKKDLASSSAQLANQSFVERAPKEKVDEIRRREAELTGTIQKLERELASLGA